MKFVGMREDSLHYIFSWYGLSDTGDTINVSVEVNRKWPYLTGKVGGGYCEFMYKTRRSLRNLFPVLERDSADLERHLYRVENDSSEWLVEKEKMGEYLKRGHYYLLNKTDSVRLIEFYVPVTRSIALGYENRRVYLTQKDDTTVYLIPYSVDFDHSKVDSLCWQLPVRIDVDESFEWIVDKEKLLDMIKEGQYIMLSRTDSSYVMQMGNLSACMKNKSKSKRRYFAPYHSIRIDKKDDKEVRIKILDLPWRDFYYNGRGYKGQDERDFKIYQYRIE